MPGDPGATVVTTLVCYQHTAHEAAGATGTRHSPRPLFSGRRIHAQLGRIAPRERRGVFDANERATLSVVIARHRVSPDDRLRRAIRYSRDDDNRIERQRTGYPAYGLLRRQPLQKVMNEPNQQVEFVSGHRQRFSAGRRLSCSIGDGRGICRFTLQCSLRR